MDKSPEKVTTLTMQYRRRFRTTNDSPTNISLLFRRSWLLQEDLENKSFIASTKKKVYIYFLQKVL